MGFSQLRWGVKESFRGYVKAAGGSITVGDGASLSEDGTIVFSAVAGGTLSFSPDGKASGSMRFEGTVVFDAHGGMLKSTLSSLGIEIINDELVLTVAESPGDDSRCTIATLGPVEIGTDGSVTLGSKITMDGMYQIADNYMPGTELDPVFLK